MKNGADGGKTLSPCRQVLFAFTVLAVLLLSVYGDSFNGSWQFDDAANITNNTAIHLKSLSWGEMEQTLLRGHVAAHATPRPVVYLSFGLNYLLGGLDVFGYHLVNWLIHFLASFFVFLFIRALLTLESVNKEYSGYAYQVALLASVLWAIHPLQTQAVTYLVQRMTSLAGMFYIMSLTFYLKARTSAQVIRSAAFLCCCVLSFLMALGSKENALQMLLSLGLCEVLLIKGTGSWGSPGKRKAFIALLGAAGLIGLLWMCLGNGVSAVSSGFKYRPFTLWERLLTQSRVLVFYLSLLLYPMPERLSLFHEFPISTSLWNPLSTLFSVVSLAGILGVLIAAARRYAVVSFCFLFFFVNHLMESTFLPLDLIYEHRNYIPSMLFFVPFALGFCSLLGRHQEEKRMRVALSLFAALVIAGFGHATYERNRVWKDPQTLWLDALGKAPGESRVHHNVAAFYQGGGQLHKAMEEYEKALSLNTYPRKGEEAVTYFNLGNLHRDLGDPEQAGVLYQKAVQVDPACYPALNSLAVLYEREGRKDDVLPLLLRALKAEPRSSNTNYNFGLFHLKSGDPEKAVPYLATALEDPGIRHSARVSMGVAYKQMGSRGKAYMLFEQALAANPKDVVPRLHLVDLYRSAGLEERALDQGRDLMDILLKDDTLFYNTVGFVHEKGRSKEVGLSSEAILPVLHQAMRQRGDIFESQLSYLKKILDKESKIE
jgi:Tfp pilus assembly protein PilF